MKIIQYSVKIQWKLMKFNENIWKFHMIKLKKKENLWKSTKQLKIQWKTIEIEAYQWQSLKVQGE